MYAFKPASADQSAYYLSLTAKTSSLPLLSFPLPHNTKVESGITHLTANASVSHRTGTYKLVNNGPAASSMHTRMVDACINGRLGRPHWRKGYDQD